MLSTDILDLACDPVTGHVIVNPLTGTSWSSGITGVAQRVSIRLKLFVGEWALNLDAGTDWNSYLGEKENLVGVRAEVARVVLGTPGIIGMSNLSVALNSARLLSITFSMKTAFGDTTLTVLPHTNG